MLQMNEFVCCVFQKLDQVMCERKVAFVNFQRMIAVRAKFFFITMLSSRQYNGRMDFDHKNEQLTMFVSEYSPFADGVHSKSEYFGIIFKR